jgi:hypothetical protein
VKTLYPVGSFHSRGLRIQSLHPEQEILANTQGFRFVFIWSGFSILGWIPIRMQGFDDQTLKKNYNFKKITFYLSLGLRKERPSYRMKESFSSQKRTSNTSKHEIFEFFSTFLGHFWPPGSGTVFQVRIRTGPLTWLKRIQYGSGSALVWVFWIPIRLYRVSCEYDTEENMIYRKVSSASTEEGLVVYPPPPPPVATGPGLDRPLQAPQPEYVESPGPYTMMRTARF